MVLPVPAAHQHLNRAVLLLPSAPARYTKFVALFSSYQLSSSLLLFFWPLILARVAFFGRCRQLFLQPRFITLNYPTFSRPPSPLLPPSLSIINSFLYPSSQPIIIVRIFNRRILRFFLGTFFWPALTSFFLLPFCLCFSALFQNAFSNIDTLVELQAATSTELTGRLTTLPDAK